MPDGGKCPWCGSLLETNQVGRAWCSNRISCGYTRTVDGFEYRFYPTTKDGGYYDPGRGNEEVYIP